MQVEYSDRGKPNYYNYYGGRISEEDIESERERRTTPPGTIKDEISQDVMSEHIGHSLQMLKMKHGRFVSKHPMSSASIVEGKMDILNSKISTIINMKDSIPLANDAHHITNFKKVYDRLFREFKEQLITEYSQMRNVYITEYEENY